MKFTKLISLLCALVMLLSLFASCANTGSGDETTVDNASTEAGAVEPEETKDPNYDDDGYLKSSLPVLNYKGEEVNLLVWEDVERPEFEVLESETGLDIVKDAIYERNMKVEDTLGVKLLWTEQVGDSNDLKAFVGYVQNCHSSGVYYDIIATYSRTAASLSASSLLMDLNTVEDS